MKFSGLFPFLLLALGTLALWAVEGAENEALKAGACPPRKSAQCFGNEKPRCSSDWQCPHKKKCCLDTCGTECLDPVNITNPVKKKPGTCPVIHGQCLMLKPLNHCETDDQCIGALKCCKAMCGKVCLSPVKA
ncbi:antileukoproteinase precursor [Ovis aries]|uniref:Antileukoproteinase n=1 Tax=Ovis aries TaxID=9940 RepID=SLPI_SHEEP|nr:antileukoproteinase precursor [Ovis aries]Q6V9X0.1 RecName: Full=Antileukoproteinase; Short=ALP; AltName: Full=Secretory leukocyte protease inhibitor; Flags: Precursor [Ovis aries]AAQ23185.1 SLPI [Ovis aries]